MGRAMESINGHSAPFRQLLKFAYQATIHKSRRHDAQLLETEK